MVPTFTVLIGSAGRLSLRRSLDSIARQQLLTGDQVIVAFDAHEKSEAELTKLHSIVASYGDGFVSTHHIGINTSEPKHYPEWFGNGAAIPMGAAYHWLGVEQINHAMRTVPMTGTHLFTIGDDDVFVNNAYKELRPIVAADPWRPVMFRFVAPNGAILWDKPRLRPCLISGCCIAAPKQFSNLMHTRIETTHDYDWIVEILKKAKAFGKKPLWLDYVGVVARPGRADDEARYCKRPIIVDEVPDETEAVL